MSITEPISRDRIIAADPLALEPLGPIALRPARLPATLAPADPLALEPLAPVVPQPDLH
jgi:hypothetical protein